MLPNGLPHAARIHLKRDFERIIHSSAKQQNSILTLWCVKRCASSPARFAVVVSKKLGPAVVRNRTKRILRESFRLNRFRMLEGVDVIVKPRCSEKLSTVQAAQHALTSLCGKAAILKGNPR